MSKYRILTIDGGGIRGLLVAILLERLQQAHPGFLEQIDLFAGTSTGGILALSLASGISPTEGRRLYEEKGPQVFADSLWDDVKDLGFTVGAQYDIQNLVQALSEQFGKLKLADLPKKVVISAFDLDNEGDSPDGIRSWKPKFFHNFPGPDSDGMESVVDVAARTSSVPSYFQVYQGYIDGGVVAVNPSMCALTQALDAKTGGQELADVTLLSIGTGRNPKFLPVQDADWGWAQWAVQKSGKSVDTPLLSILVDGVTGVADYQCRRLLHGRYHRLNPILPTPIGLDAVDQMPQLVKVAETADLTATLEWLDTTFLPS